MRAARTAGYSPAIASGEYAASLAEVTQTPADLAGCLALAVLAVAAGGKVWVQAPAWREPANLFTVVVLPPGNRKSEVYRAMCAPIKTAEKALIADAEPVIAEAVIRRRMAEAEADKTTKAAENALHPAEKDAALAEAARAKLGFCTASPEVGAEWTDDGTRREQRQLKARPEGEWRRVPTAPPLTKLLR